MTACVSAPDYRMVQPITKAPTPFPLPAHASPILSGNFQNAVSAIELILPDVHQQHDVAQRIVNAVPHTHLTLLGDYFDDYGDSPAQAAATAQWLAALLDSHPAEEGYLTALMGNHDLPYRWPDNDELMCSGNTYAKHFAINSHMRPEHWDRLECYRETQGWLLSHAGFHPKLLSAIVSPNSASFGTFCVDGAYLAREALQCVRAAAEGRHHPWLAVGRDRGGWDAIGGIFWCDWSRLPATPGVKQTVGHTRGTEPRYNSGGGGVAGMERTRWCLDTHLRHYGVLEGGELRVGAVADL